MSSISDNVKKTAAKNLQPKPFPIVGVGASAGGLEAFITLLKYLDTDLGMAYVLIMHLSPHHKSALTEIVRSKTKMPVHTVKDGMEVMADNIYVIPPNTFMSVVDGHLKLAPRELTSIGNYAVDYFLTTLASIYKNNAIGVILSGTASDGTIGLKAIKAEGGITFAQDETAEFSGMPKNAYDSGYVDFRLPPEEIANELSRLGKIPYTILPPEKIEAQQIIEITGHATEVGKILSIVNDKWDVDFFHQYKQASIYRRIVRRMALNKFDKPEDYCSMLASHPKEVDALYNDFLINVTHFFRDPAFYISLTNEIFPALLKKEVAEESIRIWVAGCSTGEEAYSIAICLCEFLEKEELVLPIQIFASDLDANAIEKARLGIYHISALQGISAPRLKQYFKKNGDQYQIIKSIREICVFSQHNLLKDPPFSRMHLISCQNVLIYLETDPQKRILQTFHYALKPIGYLYLGKAETIGASIDLFEQLDKKDKIYSRRSTKSPQLAFTINGEGSKTVVKNRQSAEQFADVEKDMRQLMLSRYVHPSVVVDKSGNIVQFFGAISSYLAPLTGKASLNVLKMIREDLVIELSNLFHHARKTEQSAIKEGIRIYNKKILQEITIEVVPKRTSGEIFFLVVFKETVLTLFSKIGGSLNGKTDQKEKTILRLEEELVQSRVLIKTTSEEYETTYEELQANNEEILSSNEELQSVNEELEASKEELQSSNEELTSTNEELNKKNKELNASQQALKKVNEQLAEFAFISSHDLQEPLRKIETFADLLSSPEAHLNDYAKKYTDKIQISATRMSALIKDLLVFSLLNKNDEKEPLLTDLNEILKDVLKYFELIIESKQVVITFSSLPSIYGDPAQFSQLFHNLISNALKFSKKNPVINISSREVSSDDFPGNGQLMKDVRYTAISVEDNGIGFRQKYVDTMFVLFRRLHNNTKGTGVGLAICKRIVEDHHGCIIANGKENAGAVFTVVLPFALA